ncbi:MAG TPA: tetratricopeptide repeat protein [Terriglobales bacterium]|nr:tetratricopeptide repeat protein [Terriglobales bacterium]
MRFFLHALSLLLLSCLASIPAVADEEHQHPAGDPEKLGSVSFPTSCAPAVQKQFQRGVAMMHSFWYEEAERTFNQVAQDDPGCAMAYWGLAMSYFHPIWDTRGPDAAMLKKGAEAVEKAKALSAKTERERDYVAAIEVFYKDSDKLDHRTRVLAYESAMERVYTRYPDDREAAAFYSLALLGSAAASPVDKTLARQKKAGEIAEKVFAAEPNHPGAPHYVIHAYDYPPLAERALPAARAYAKIAPDAPHALHMPSHIFTRLGLWQESIESNIASAAAARKVGMVGEGLHASDYLVYAYLQTGQDEQAKRVLDQMAANKTGLPSYFAGVYATAAMPARYVVERRSWGEAANLDIPSGLPGGKLSWAEATIYFARALGNAHTGNVEGTRQAIQKLEAVRDLLTQAQETYWAGQVEIQRREAAGTLSYAQGKKDEALDLLRSAADMEDASEKHPVTPGPVVPARELLGEMLLAMDQPAEALAAFESALQRSPNRFNALYGAARAAQIAGQREKARQYYSALVAVSDPVSPRPELRTAKSYLQEVARK